MNLTDPIIVEAIRSRTGYVRREEWNNNGELRHVTIDETNEISLSEMEHGEGFESNYLTITIDDFAADDWVINLAFQPDEG